LRGRGWEAVMRKSGTDLWMALWQRAHTRKILLCHVNIHQRSLVVVHWTKLYTCQLLIFPSYFLTRSVGTGTKRPWCQVWKLFFGSKLGLSLTKSELLTASPECPQSQSWTPDKILFPSMKKQLDYIEPFPGWGVRESSSQKHTHRFWRWSNFSHNAFASTHHKPVVCALTGRKSGIFTALPLQMALPLCLNQSKSKRST
jgi:hypothetical protein